MLKYFWKYLITKVINRYCKNLRCCANCDHILYRISKHGHISFDHIDGIKCANALCRIERSGLYTHTSFVCDSWLYNGVDFSLKECWYSETRDSYKIL